MATDNATSTHGRDEDHETEPLTLDERQVQAFEKAAEALKSLADVLGWWYTLELQKFQIAHPEHGRKRRAGEIHRPGDEKREHFSDKGDQEWFEETEKREPSRFQERFEQQNKPKPKPKSRS